MVITLVSHTRGPEFEPQRKHFFAWFSFFFLLTEDLLFARRDEVFIVLDLDIPLNLRAFWGQIHWTEWDWIWLNWFLLICDKYYLDPGALPEFFSRGERCWQQPYPPRLHLPHSTPIKLVLARLAICEYFQRTVPYFHCCPVLMFKNLFLVPYFFLQNFRYFLNFVCVSRIF